MELQDCKRVIPKYIPRRESYLTTERLSDMHQLERVTQQALNADVTATIGGSVVTQCNTMKARRLLLKYFIYLVSI